MIFLINFDDLEYASIEHWLKSYREELKYHKLDSNLESDEQLQIISLQKISHAENSTLLNKRAELFTKGGAFSLTYKQLVLDILTKRISPSIINGFLLNDAHRIRNENSPEAFLTKLIRKENPTAFIKCFCTNPNSITRGGQYKVESLMKHLQVDNLFLYPRIKQSIKQTLDNLPQLNVHHHEIEFSKITFKIHQLLMKLMQECLDELKREFTKFRNVDHKTLSDNILVLENALLKSFRPKLREHIGAAEFNFIGFKTKALLKNIDEIKSLLNTLLNRCCISFYV